MRRNDRKIESALELHDILSSGRICRLGMIDDGRPYIVPMSYGYSDGFLYLHCAREGKKLELIRENPHICFEIETDAEVQESELAANWTIRYRSIIGYGRIEIVDDFQDKIDGFRVLMRSYSGRDDWEFDKNCVDNSYILKLEIISMTGKMCEG